MSDDPEDKEDGEAKTAWGRLEPFARASFRAELEDFFAEAPDTSNATGEGTKDGDATGGAGPDAAGDTVGGGGTGGAQPKAPAKAKGQEAGFDLSGFLFGKPAAAKK